MRILIRLLGPWGFGDLLCADPMLTGLVERHGPDTELWLEGRPGNLIHHPAVRGLAGPGFTADETIEVRLFTHLPAADYARLEAMPSLIDHMCSYAGVTPTNRKPNLYLSPDDRLRAAATGIGRLRRPRIALCTDFSDPLRHWPAARWREVGETLRANGASLVEVGSQDRLGLGLDLVGQLSLRETAAVLEQCDLFVGHNSGLFHYAQAAGTPCVTLFSLATPERFLHPGARVRPVQADLPCKDCMTRCFATMRRRGCISSPRGLCMLEIQPADVLEAVADMLEQIARTRAQGVAGLVRIP